MTINISPDYYAPIAIVFFALCFAIIIFKFIKTAWKIKNFIVNTNLINSISQITIERPIPTSEASLTIQKANIKLRLIKFFRAVLLDKSLWALTASNILIAYFLITGGQNIRTIVLVMWVQCLIIGLFNVIRILRLKEFSVEGFKINDRQVSNTPATKYLTAIHFIISYGVFLYFALQAIPGLESNAELIKQFGAIAFSGAILFLTHLFSFIYNTPRDTKKQNIGTLMFYPFIRIFPMFIIGGLASANVISAAVSLFIIKTISDIVAHVVEHFLRKGQTTTIGQN